MAPTTPAAPSPEPELPLERWRTERINAIAPPRSSLASYSHSVRIDYPVNGSSVASSSVALRLSLGHSEAASGGGTDAAWDGVRLCVALGIPPLLRGYSVPWHPCPGLQALSAIHTSNL